MTREEAISYFERNIEILERVLNERPDLKGPEFDTEFQASDMAIKALEQYSILDKIRAEINSPNRGSCDYFIVDRIEEIINEYKAESEDRE